MATLEQSAWDFALAFLQIYVIPYIIVLAIAFLSVAFAFNLWERNNRYKAKVAFSHEVRGNAKVTKEIVSYADGQLSGETSVQPMPRYELQAFREYKNLGLLRRLKPKIADEFESLYLSLESVNEAGRRQEELAFGPAAAFPNAHTLRLENLTYLRDTAHNIIEPYLDRMKTTRV
ncbi:MAG TPA: hypothetical protein VGR53_09080 [Nitrososphaerales archaeon]|nr:hypothetical protein [Nitrososphaerales archaeon]